MWPETPGEPALVVWIQGSALDPPEGSRPLDTQ